MGVGQAQWLHLQVLVCWGIHLYLHLSTREESRLYAYDLIVPMMVKGEQGYKGKPLRAFLI